MNDEDADEDEATSDRIREIAESIDRMDDRPAFYPPEIMAERGAVLFLDYDGELVIERGLMAKAEAPKTDAAGQGKPSGDPSSLSAPLAEYLTAQKTAAIRAELAQSPSVALAAVVHALTLKVFYHGGSTCLQISTRLNSLKSVIKNADDCKAMSVLDADRDRWQDHLPGDRADLWAWCIGQTQDTLLDLMAICAAHTVDAVQTKNGGQDANSLAPCRRSGRGPANGHGAVVYAHRVQLLRQNRQTGHACRHCRGEGNALRPRMGEAEKAGTGGSCRAPDCRDRLAAEAGAPWARGQPQDRATVVAFSKAA